MKIIGIAGVARSGKDTLAECFKKIIEKQGKKCEIRSFAFPLKEDLKDSIMADYGIDVWECSDEQKSKIRPILVEYGKRKRTETNGRYFIKEMEKQIQKLPEDTDFLIIPDVRYSEYEEDEADWILEEKKGDLVHIQKIMEDGQILKAPNEEERKNDPILLRKAQERLIWPSGMTFQQCLTFINKIYGKDS